jgi:hypothetical protein
MAAWRSSSTSATGGTCLATRKSGKARRAAKFADLPPIMRSVGYPAGSHVGACRISVESLTLATATGGMVIHLLQH